MSINYKYTVQTINNYECHEWFLKKHYAKRIPNIMNCFGLYNENKQLEGVISYGSPPSPSLVVGSFNGKYTEIFLELNRLCVNENLEKNVLSYFVSQSIKQMSKPKVLVSYADTSQGHHGYIYQATNWIYTGLTAKRTEWRMRGSDKHSKTICEQYTLEKRLNSDKFYVVDRPRKHRYFYLYANKKDKKEMIKNLAYGIEPYPKGNNKKYDASYQCATQGVLF
tara:strand:- start:23 stop:691 length:669 start_codon:yes stop_codon:yes gene_type:complete